MKYIEKFNIDNEEFQIVPPVATEQQLGGIKTKVKDTESVPVAVDENGQAFVPPYPDGGGKLDIAQGADNANKVMVVDETGNLVPTEFKGGSDNKLIGTVAKSENPSVSDSYNTELMNLKFYGKSTQESTTGAQLWQNPAPTTLQGVRLTIEDDGWCVLNGTCTASAYFALTNNSLDSDTYTLSVEKMGSFPSANTPFVQALSNKLSESIILNYPDNSINQNLNSSDDYIYIIYFQNGFTYNNSRVRVMLNKGSEALSWEPFTGGQPSPSPEYPQQVTAIEEVSGLIVGNQLFDSDSMEQVTVPSGSKWGYEINLPSGNYTLSTTNPNNVPGTETYLYIQILSKYGEWSKITYAIGNQSPIKNIPIALEDGDIIYFYDALGGITNEISKQRFQQMDYMLNKGSSALPYEPYTEQPFTFTLPEPLYSTQDGNVADVVNVATGENEYNMQKYIVTGEENFFQDYQGQSGYYGRYLYLENGAGTLNDKVFCNYLPYENQSWAEPRIGFSQNAGKQIHLKFSNETLGITDDTPLAEKQTAFTNYLKQLYASDNPLYVVVVVNPTTQPIPQETLAVLRALKSNNGVTNVICNAPVSFQYEQSLQIVIQNILNSIAQTNANLLLNTSKEG